PADQKEDVTADEDMEEANDAGGSDDAAPADRAAARRALFPSSIGLSLLVPKDAKALHVTVRWGDYCPLIRGEGGQLKLFEPAPAGGQQAALIDQGEIQGWRRRERVELLTLKLPKSQKPSEEDVPDSGGLKVALSVRPIRDIAAFDGLVPRGT